MKNSIYFFLLLCFPITGIAQHVGIGTTTPQSRLEVKDTSLTRLTIASKNFADTTRLVLSNRTAANLGTDMILSANQERGIRVTAQSDLAGNRHDSIMTLTPQGRVGINNTDPAERLDVRGNVNITGIIKANGNAGEPNQVLMQDAVGNLAWGSMGNNYKNFETYHIPVTSTWTVPAGVTEVMVELVGGGAGGTIWGGGGGGGYIMAKFAVTAGGIFNFTVGAGSAGTSGSNSVDAGSSIVSFGGVSLTAQGGLGGVFNNTFKNYGSVGGVFFITPSTFKNFMAFPGAAGQMIQLTFQQRTATAFYEVVSDGNGGGPGYCRTCISQGTHIIYDNSAAAILRYTNGDSRSVAGAGGSGGYILAAGGFGGGGPGKDGLVIFRY